jgi:short-subunit dehydrogenase
MAAKIKDSVVVITGASAGIGRCTALEIARKGGTVVLASRQPAALEQVRQECQELGGRALAVPTDVTDQGAVDQLAKSAVETFGRIDAWVNNAAISLFARFEQAPPEAFRRVIETNLFGYVHGARAVLPYFREQGRGVLVNLSSMNGKVAAPFTSAYITTKFAIIGFSESLRMELQDAPDIHVSTILPSSIDTPIFQHAANYTGRAIKPLDPVYPPEKVARAIVRCIRHPRREVVVGNAGRSLVVLRTLAPSLAERMVARQVTANHFQDRQERRSDGNLFHPMPQFNSVSGGWRNGQASKTAMATAGSLFLAGLAAASWWMARLRKPKRRTVKQILRGRGSVQKTLQSARRTLASMARV